MDWDAIAADALAVLHETLTRLRAPIEAAAERLASCLRSGGKVLLCGNGGSAADAQHMAAELVNRFLLDRPAWPAIALSTDTSALTAIGNDCGFDAVFARQVEALGRPGDALVAFSTSGRSPNVLRAVEVARRQGLWTLAITGGDGGALAGAADASLCVSVSAHTPRIQEGHQLILHLLCERIEELLAGGEVNGR
ncbi:MAG: SIS domain-containing protein [Kiritimatiellae bacterium]|nr:SIS domain-containing protein [Kiritimatiellia bacterium]